RYRSRCFFSSRRRHTRFSRDWSSDVCSSDLFLLYLILSVYTIVAEAQTLDIQGNYTGAAASFQTRVFTLSSDIEALDGLLVVQEGGQAGLFFGNRVIRTRIGLLGLLYSSMHVPRTINVFEVEAGI